MVILILEDNITRQETFKTLFKHHVLLLATTVKEAQDWCEVYNIDIMLLDHDLGPGLDNTGYTFVKWLCENEIYKKAMIYIHSINCVGANRMLNLLKDFKYTAIWVPFNQMIEGEL